MRKDRTAPDIGPIETIIIFNRFMMEHYSPEYIARKLRLANGHKKLDAKYKALFDDMVLYYRIKRSKTPINEKIPNYFLNQDSRSVANIEIDIVKELLS